MSKAAVHSCFTKNSVDTGPKMKERKIFKLYPIHHINV